MKHFTTLEVSASLKSMKGLFILLTLVACGGIGGEESAATNDRTIPGLYFHSVDSLLTGQGYFWQGCNEGVPCEWQFNADGSLIRLWSTDRFKNHGRWNYDKAKNVLTIAVQEYASSATTVDEINQDGTVIKLSGDPVLGCESCLKRVKLLDDRFTSKE